MPSIRKKTTKDGRDFYEITVSRGRSKSRLYSRWYVPEGWSKRAIDRELAKVAAEFERRCNNGEIMSRSEQKERAAQNAAERDKIFTLKQYGERVYMPSKSVTISENTRSSFQGNLNNWIYPALGELKITDISAADISALLIDIQNKGKYSTAIKNYTILKTLFKAAYMADLIDRNPMDKVERPKAQKATQHSELQAYTADEIRYIMGCLKNEPLQWQVYIRLLIDTGMRRGECCALKWENIDFDENTITISGNLCYTPQKGVYLDTPKNGKSRIVDVDQDIIAMLKQLRNTRRTTALYGYVFTARDEAAPMHPQTPTKYLKVFAKKYDIADLHPHKLRHSFASIAITSGADIASVSEKLGHSDKSITLRMYTHADNESIKRAGDIFREAVKATG